MRRRAIDRQHRGQSMDGFSLIELMIVLAIGIVVSVISIMSLVPVMQTQHVTNAYNTTLAALRQARDCSVSQRTSYQVTFQSSTSPVSIAVAATTSFPGDACTATYQFPSDVTFKVPPTGTTAPDSGGGTSFGTGANAIDFGYTSSSSAGGATTIYFCPDGSAQTSSSCSGAGNWDNGVVYLARSGDNGSYRAIDVWGGTGRVRGWRLYAASGGGYQWVRQ